MSLPETMRAAVYRERRNLAVERRPLPELGPHDVLLRVAHCGVCGTDLHLVLDGWGRKDSIGGHEYSGRVAAVGPSVTRFAVGDAAIGGPDPGCGTCAYCRAHRPGLCATRGGPGMDAFQGAFAEFVRASEASLVAVPVGVSLRDAALCEPLAVALHGITRSGIRPGGRALVTGAGPIGMLTLAALRAQGVDDVTVSEPSALRRDLAARLGAAKTLEPGDLRVPPLPFDIVDGACDAAFECSGRGDALRAALAQLKRAGTLVIVGTGMERPRLDCNRVLLNELVVTGAYNYDENGFEDALHLLASGRLDTDLLIEPDDIGLDDMLGAMERLAAGEIGGKVLVAPDPNEEMR